MIHTIALTEAHRDLLAHHFFSRGEVTTERAAFLFFRKVTTERRTTFLLKEIRPVPEEYLDASASHVTWSNDQFIPCLKIAAARGFVVGIAHSHLVAPPFFSEQDNRGERDLHSLCANRNGADTELISLVMAPTRDVAARVWSAEGFTEIEDSRIIGRRYAYRGRRFSSTSSPELARQALAFGEQLNKTIAGLKIVVVGCGGTGSPVAMLLARLGAKKVSFIDPDIVELTNLNRLHGAYIEDARERRAKVEVAARQFLQIQPQASVRTLQASIAAPETWDELRDADIIFGCTDDNLGRLLLNRFAYFYLVPVIDMGLAIEVAKNPPHRVLALDGRVTCIGPGETCLLCRGVVSPRRASEESLKVSNPLEFARQKAEAYVEGEGNPNPSVVTFTTEVATMALNELIHRLHGFRGERGETASRTRQFHRSHDLRPGDLPQESCPICYDDYYWAMGDVLPFLDAVW